MFPTDKIYGHGRWDFGGRGDGSLNPADAMKDYGADAFRYFVFLEAPFGEALELAAEFVRDLVWSLRLLAGWLYHFMPDASARMQMLMSVGGAEPHRAPPLFPGRR